ncbi:hypothetical protein [Halobacillus karajensis]|uniref:Uncharacterized protein n=1 Tax=Halobacillus karajensis TaxID=195088 RepID=A0A024P7D5_9BACI|nr:hypothetical protein [Halobacillus karajensis]CDQ21086.1 hypothetical protein BN982_03449 [Halobacillus karajensis]CDQ24850.1 hypothetical protein BN983_03149 [Halobacillus karajensis]CDQ28790.1 hypothetical protein BN981_03105 [Halobacillus karajensis]
MEELHEALMDARKGLLEKERLHRESEKLKEELNHLYVQEQQYRERLTEEEEDVEKLERMSLTNLFVTITGQKLGKLEKEKQEVVEARLKWKEAHQSLADVETELENLNQKIKESGDQKGEYNRLYQRKKQFLISRGREKGKRLLELSDKRSTLQAELSEISEAIVAGQSAMSALEEASKSLTSAENWGAIDMLGGGLLTTAVKHSRVNDADTAIHTAQRHLRKFANEIDDLGKHYDANIQISGGLTVADYFFDGLIVDWFVQNKIQSSHKEVREIRKKTHQALLDLETLERQFEKEEQAFKEEMDRIVRYT